MDPYTFLESWDPPTLWDRREVVREFLKAYQAAQEREQAATDPYAGKRETIVLDRQVTDRGIRRTTERK